jgi:hypothetical protein
MTNWRKRVPNIARRFLLAVLLLLGISFAGLQRLNHLQDRPIELSEFSWFNKVEIYTAYVLMNVLGAPLYPEIAKEGLLMLLPSSEGKEITFESDFFFESEFVQDKIDNYYGPISLYWPWDSYVMIDVFGKHSEARVALALNTGTLSVEETRVKVSVPCTWPQDAWIHLLNVPWLPEIRIQEGLFWVLEQEGWIHPYTAVWEADLPE